MITDQYSKELTEKQVYSIAGGHLFHDLYTSFLAPLLPTLMDSLSINLTGRRTTYQHIKTAIYLKSTNWLFS